MKTLHENTKYASKPENLTNLSGTGKAFPKPKKGLTQMLEKSGVTNTFGGATLRGEDSLIPISYIRTYLEEEDEQETIRRREPPVDMQK